jgi:hypothetical protein
LCTVPITVSPTSPTHTALAVNNHTKTPELILPLPLIPMDPVIDTSNTKDSAPLAATITHHCFAAVVPTQIKGQIYTNLTGRFPVTSSCGNSQIFVLYDYDNNSIQAQAMPSKTATKILKAFKKFPMILFSQDYALNSSVWIRNAPPSYRSTLSNKTSPFN